METALPQMSETDIIANDDDNIQQSNTKQHSQH